jgi:hypothetical protein
MSAWDLIRENTHILVHLEANPHTQAFASPFVQIQDELFASLADENKLILGIARAEARARILDNQIDALVDELKHAILVITGDDKTAKLWTDFFGEHDPGQIKEPLLDAELDIVGAWPTKLAGLPHASLQAIGAKLEPLVAAGVPAMQAMSDANRALADFYEVGARYALVQKMNAARKAMHGQLGALVHDHPELSLSTSFPDTFCLHAKRRKKETPASIAAEIAALRKKIEVLEIKREKLIAVLAAGETAGEKLKDRKKAEELAKAEREAARVAAKVAALKSDTNKVPEPDGT